jgi:hypothetical protein
MKNIKLLSLTSLFLCAVLQIQAQINLSIQGTIQEASGANLENGEYAMTFRLYDTETGGTPVWSETQDVVDVIGGVYSTLLGKVNPLNAAFDKTYYLGVSLNYGAEVVPRTRLTASPYAFSMVGQNNVFPSVGAAGAGTSAPDNSAALHLKREGGTGVLLLESDVNSAVSMKKGNNKAKISYDGVRISVTNLNIGSINLLPGKTVIYEDRKDWRLVAVHNFSDINDDEYFTVNGWRANREDYASPRRAWATSSSDGIIRVLSQNKPFYRGKIMMVQSQPGNALKKEIDLHWNTSYYGEGSFYLSFFGFLEFRRIVWLCRIW